MEKGISPERWLSLSLSLSSMAGWNMATYPVAELNHFRDDLLIDRWEDGTPDKFHILTGELIHIHLCRRARFKTKTAAVQSHPSV